MKKSLDEKLNRIAKDSSCKDFILADAKDPDMGLGIAAPGPRRNRQAGQTEFRSMPELHALIREIVEQGLVDIMLMSPSTSEQLAINENLFDKTRITAAVRANDTTDIWCGSSGTYTSQPSLPFRSATIAQLQSGQLSFKSKDKNPKVDLGLYSITFNNHAELDRDALNEYREFRLESEAAGFRHFLEVFAPNANGDSQVKDVGRYVNDCIVRCLAGVPKSSRPCFLKIPYFGPEAMDALSSYDPSIVVGILGGSAGTTMDAFKMLSDAKKYGARAALFGRKINLAEDQLAMVKYLRLLADGEIEPVEAVRAYHADLERNNIAPIRDLDSDLQATQV
jgi:hypothetical protein